MIQIEDLQKSFGAVRAVAGVSLDVPRGQTLGLLGPNGAGKTTTMSMLAGLLRPDAGSIRIGEFGGPEIPAARATLGLAPQSLAVYANLTGRENLRFFGQLYGLGGPKLAERAEWALKFTGLDKRGDDRAGTYSGGMQRRLNLACALVHEPSTLLLDEPTVGVDPQSRNHLLENILALKQQGLTILYTTHYMEEAEKLCDRIAIMDEGKVLADGSLPELLAKHGGKSVVEMELKRVPETQALPGKLDGRTLRFDSADAGTDVLKLAQGGVEFETLNVHRPSLEDVFLSLTGRSLRD